MSMSKLSNDILLVLAYVSQITDPDSVRSRFIESLNALDDAFAFKFVDRLPPGIPENSVLPIATLRSSFGFAVNAEGPGTSETERVVFRNAFQFLAVLLENRLQASALKSKNESLLKEINQEKSLVRTILDTLPVGVWVADGQGTILMGNAAGEKMWAGIRYIGIDQYSEYKARWSDTGKRVEPEEWALARAIKMGETSINEEIDIECFDGTHKTILNSAAPLLDDERRIIGAVGINQDITERKQAEEALRESEEKYRALVETAAEAIFIAQDGMIRFCNKSFSDISGYESADLANMAFSDFVHPDDRQMVFDRYIQRLEGNDVPSRYRFRFVDARGNTRWADMSVALISWEGKPASLCLAADITELKQAEEALKRSEEKYRHLFERALEGILVARGETLEFVNPALERILGYPLEKITSGPFINFIHPDDRAMVLERHLRRMRDESVETGYDFRVIASDGTVKWLTINSQVIDWEGTQANLSFLTDITDRKRAEEREKETLALLRMAGDKAKLGGWSANLEDNLVIWSDEVAAIHEMPAGYSPLVEQGISFYTPEWRERITKVFTDCAQKGIPYDEEMEIITAGGKRIWVKTIGEPVKNDAGKIIKVQGAFQDITERKQTEVLLQESEGFLQKIFDILPVGLWFADKKGKLLRGNPAGMKIWGAEPQVAPAEYGAFKARRLPSGEEISPDDWALAHTIKNGTTIVDELLEIDAFDGKKKIILNYTAPVMDDCEEIKGAIVVNQDITELKQAEKNLLDTLESLRKAFATTIQVMVSAVESRDPYTSGHQTRSADLARAIATEMGLPPEKIDGIRMAGSIHDIGKLSIPAEILSKPTKLTNIEFSLIKEHSLKGYEMLKDVESPWPLAEIVYQHHERMDGSGYPRQLKGDEILIEARILAVADVVEAMASHRPYRPGLGIDAALNEIEKNRGIFYDKAVADTCLRLFRKKGFQLVTA